MKRVLTSLERKAVFDSAGKTKIEFVICAVSSVQRYNNVDSVVLCGDNNEIKKAEKELRKEFPKDEIRVIKSRATRIE